jgi:hypothetical protein
MLEHKSMLEHKRILEEKLKTTWYFYLHILVIILGLVLPILIPKRKLVYLLIFILVILFHWILLGGECILTYLERVQLKKFKITLKESFFYKMFKKYFDLKLNKLQVDMFPIFLNLYMISVCIFRLYF